MPLEVLEARKWRGGAARAIQETSYHKRLFGGGDHRTEP
jgi:hypothetical protein